MVQSAEGGKGKDNRERINVVFRSPCVEKYPADAHTSAHNQCWSLGVMGGGGPCCCGEGKREGEGGRRALSPPSPEGWWGWAEYLSHCSQLQRCSGRGIHSPVGADRLGIPSLPDREVWRVLYSNDGGEL